MTWIPTKNEAFLFEPMAGTFLVNMWIVPCPKRSGVNKIT